MDKCINKIIELTTDEGIFDNIIDCTYVLLCCGPNPQREENVYTQLNLLKWNNLKPILLSLQHKILKKSVIFCFKN